MNIPALGIATRNLLMAIKESEMIKRPAPKVTKGELSKKPQDKTPMMEITKMYMLTGINKLPSLGERIKTILIEKRRMKLAINL